MGYGELADQVQAHYLAGEKDKAVALIPDELVDDMHIVGERNQVRERVAQWAETGVTTLLLSCRNGDEVRSVAEILA
jgi:alkanesulfonate monooxygenase SsuD/methylene tetrahydromethanopterin reductase-like flavin-dependent oxidoreductase (luciferase family)